MFGCHELEVYPDDRLTCGSGNALLGFDMSGAFRKMGTPNDFSDDVPRGTPLPCKTRASSSLMPFASGASVIDCVDGTDDSPPGPDEVAADEDLTIPGWIAAGRPSLEGVDYLGSVYHQGGGPGQGSIPPFNSVQDLAFNHETELSGSGQHLIATDERGGGVFPPGATCTPEPTTWTATAAFTSTRRAGSASSRRARCARRRRRTRGPPTARRRSIARRSGPSRRRRSARRTSSSRSRARTGSSWAGTRRAPRCSTTSSSATAGSASRTRAT